MGPHEILRAIDNIDNEELKPLLKEAFTPKGTGPVAACPHFVYLVSNVIRGFSPVEVMELLEREKKYFVSAEAIMEYMLQYIPAKLLREHLLAQWLDGANEVDEVRELKRLAKIQRSKVFARVNEKAADFDEEESRRRDQDSYRKTLIALYDIKLEGFKADPVGKDNPSPAVPKATEPVKETVDSRAAAAALAALKALGIDVN